MPGLLKINLKLHNGQAKEYLAEDIQSLGNTLNIILSSGKSVSIPWEEIKKYDSTPLKSKTLEKMNEQF